MGDKISSSKQKNQKVLNQIKKYVKFYIQSFKEDEPQQIELENTIQVYLEQSKQENLKVRVDWSHFDAWNVAQLFCMILTYCGDLFAKMDKALDVRISYLSLMNYYEKYL